jgi:hypothetical protein
MGFEPKKIIAHTAEKRAITQKDVTEPEIEYNCHQ